MRIVRSLPILLTLFICPNAPAQEPAAVPDVQPLGPEKSTQQYHAEDGGAHGEILESIVIPPKRNEPFTLLLETEWVRGLPDGGSITTVNKRRIARDADGRIYMERWFLVPKDGKVKSQMTTIQISDPHNHTLYNCFMLAENRECLLVPYVTQPDAVFQFQGPPTGPLPNNMGEAIHEDLGKQLVSGVETTGTATPSSTTPACLAMTANYRSNANSGSPPSWASTCSPNAPIPESAPKLLPPRT